ncbi:hypothetical protein [Nitrosomonas sp.]|uniref:hypothetical protein n=1 Tax=Nitrosomonas sp. TaxID=42353 RepID=UPI00284BD388|nr:hypothetical protein [Nitrosomonas sp.]MDR4514400.1 hypothetical protein [Nitrosomonas sp.]
MKSIMKLGRMVSLAAACMMVFSAGTLSADQDDDDHGQFHFRSNQYPDFQNKQYPNVYNDLLQPVVTAIDYHTRVIYLFNYENDGLIIVDPLSITGWPGDVPLQHTGVLPGGNVVYITTDNTELHSSYIVALRVDDIDWNAGTVALSVESVLVADNPNTPAELPFVEQVNDKQGVPDWIFGRGTQLHGFTLLPYTNYAYLAEWSADKIRVIDLETNSFASADPIIIPGFTEQTHGVTFNPSGTIGLGTGYYFDNSIIDVYEPNRGTGELQVVGQIQLGDEKRHAAFTHYVYWLDERFALTASMQFDKTSLTLPTTKKIIPPSVWLLDTHEGTATRIIDATKHVNGRGVFRSPSDLTVANGKLYLAEEDSIDPTFGEDGYISVWDLTDRYKPRFIKRMKPGVELPQGYAVAHTISPSADDRYLLIASWVSGYVLKLDTHTDTIVKVWGPADGLVKPHGLFSAGGNR